jgi:mRNA interferase RelE/StbE
MGYKIVYSRAAEKYLDAQTRQTRIRIMDAVDGLPKGDVTKLKGRKGYRLTVGGFRVLFDYAGDSVIDVVAIGSRGDVYKK